MYPVISVPPSSSGGCQLTTQLSWKTFVTVQFFGCNDANYYEFSCTLLFLLAKLKALFAISLYSVMFKSYVGVFWVCGCFWVCVWFKCGEQVIASDMSGYPTANPSPNPTCHKLGSI